MRFSRQVLVIVLALISGCAHQAELSGEPGSFKTWADLHYKNVVRQANDFSCGAASLSTISKYYLRKEISEKEIVGDLKAHMSPEEWQKKQSDGLSMLDIKMAAIRLGLSAEGLKLNLDDALSLKGPVVLHMDRGYVKHFVVLRGIEDNRAYIADPVLGNIRIPLWKFSKEWTGYTLAVWLEEQEDSPEANKLAINTSEKTHEVVSARRALYSVSGFSH